MGPSLLEQTLSCGGICQPQLTHQDLWSGIFATGPPESLVSSGSMQVICVHLLFALGLLFLFHSERKHEDSARSTGRGKRSCRSKMKTIQGAMEEEFDITENDQGLQYDWVRYSISSAQQGLLSICVKTLLFVFLFNLILFLIMCFGSFLIFFSRNSQILYS